MSKPIKCFIVEGKSREYNFINEMTSVFFKGRYDSLTICLPAEQNIYMLYNMQKENGFETDLIELLRDSNKEIEKELIGIRRDSIDEIFLLFDFDFHQNNLARETKSEKVLEEMLAFYDNETENGKLYISYPMVEALYDCCDGTCNSHTSCFFPVDRFNQYKELVGKNNHRAGMHYRRYETWKDVISLFGLRIMCLFDMLDMDYEIYKKNVTVRSVFYKQLSLVKEKNEVFVLSAFPEFLLDYYKQDFWNKHVKLTKFKYDVCQKEIDGKK